uniref:hypothetical protein n=1 Tax=Actinotalea sp. C106 TaxID=2908644 RepID=UPI0020297B17
MLLPLVPLPEHVEVLDGPPFVLRATTVVEVEVDADDAGEGAAGLVARRAAALLGALVGAEGGLEVRV